MQLIVACFYGSPIQQRLGSRWVVEKKNETTKKKNETTKKKVEKMLMIMVEEEKRKKKKNTEEVLRYSYGVLLRDHEKSCPGGSCCSEWKQY